MRGLLGPKSILLFRVLRTWNLTRVLAWVDASVVGNLHATILWHTPNVSTTWRTGAAATLGQGNGYAIAIVGTRKTAGTPWRGRDGALGRKARWWSIPVDMRSVHTRRAW